MKGENFPIIRTRFLKPDSTLHDINQALNHFKEEKELVLKRGISGAMKDVHILQKDDSITRRTKEIIKENNSKGAYWLLQQMVPELQNGEMKIFFINGQYSFGFHLSHPRLKYGELFNITELRKDVPMWSQLDVPEAIKLGERVYSSLKKRVPSLAVIFRLDMFRDKENKLVINELEYFGNMQFMMQHSTASEARLEEMATALVKYLQD